MDEAERKRRWALENVITFELKFNPDRDTDILAKLDTVDSRQGYLRMLIRNDLIRKGIITGNLEAFDILIHRGRDRIVRQNVRANLKLLRGGPDQPIIDYLKACPSKIDYIRSLVRQDIDSGGNIADRITTPKVYVDVDTVTASAERTAKLLEGLAAQDDTQTADAQALIDAINRWIDREQG